MLTAIINLVFSLFFSSTAPAARLDVSAPLIALEAKAPRPEQLLTGTGEKAAVLAARDHFFFFTSDADSPQPIASITKLMTALVFLDNNPGWDNEYEILAEDKVEGGRLNLFLGDRVSIRNLFYTSLVASDNGATAALARSTGLSEKEFVSRMNKKAQRLGLSKTRFADPAGLGEGNLSTAHDVAFLAQAALRRPEIREATVKRDYSFQTLDGREKTVESTDNLLFAEGTSTPLILGGKTGYTEKAGYCFVGWFRSLGGEEVISVILNSAGKNERFRESRNLAAWVFDNHTWSKGKKTD